MPLSIGTRLGPYEIVSALGAGGMGEVYRARDARLDRTVAIKVLPEHLATNPDLRARLEREAKAISQLQHANICVLHDIGSESGIDFLVMEYLEGETLSARLARKAMAVGEALHIAVEIAGALDAAHAHGVIHRDLKPGNIMLTKSGAKLMDFGLAKPHGIASGSPAPAFSAVATMTSPVSPITATGTVVGTVQYMSPEQVLGQEVDARSDIFAFGATLYEMLTGKKAFSGKSQLSVASAILEKEPEGLRSLQPLTPPALERVVSKCLAKDAENRWQGARDLASELKWIAEGGGAHPVAPAAARRSREPLLYGATAVALLAAGVFGVLYWRVAQAPAQPIAFEIPAPPNTRFNFVGSGTPALAPDGHAVVFSVVDENGTSMLWARALDSATAHVLSGTDGATDPFWSPDSRSIGFVAAGMLKIVDASGGPARVLAPAEAGGTWNRDGTILFPHRDGLYRIAAAGGTPSLVLPDRALKFAFWGKPQFLPDQRHFLYWGSANDPASTGTYIASLDGKQNQLVIRDDAIIGYASGYLLDVRGSVLMAQKFDPVQGQLSGSPLVVAPSVGTAVMAGIADASQNGVLIYLPGGQDEKRLTWFDRAGKNPGAASDAGDYYDLRISPDGRKLAFNAAYPAGSNNSEVWVSDLARSVRMRLTIDPDSDHGIPVWSPDGSMIAYGVLAGKTRGGIYRKAADGSGGEELILSAESSKSVWPTSWSHDGKYILYTRGEINLSVADIGVVTLDADRKPHPLVPAPGATYDAQFSPDGRWVAYVSRESGRDEVYVIPFDAVSLTSRQESANVSGRGKWVISANGGRFPRWRGDGREIYYMTGSKQVMAVQISEKGNSIEVGTPQALFKAWAATSFAPFDVTADGKKFIIDSSEEQVHTLTLVVNWTAALKKQ